MQSRIIDNPTTSKFAEKDPQLFKQIQQFIQDTDAADGYRGEIIVEGDSSSGASYLVIHYEPDPEETAIKPECTTLSIPFMTFSEHADHIVPQDYYAKSMEQLALFLKAFENRGCFPSGY